MKSTSKFFKTTLLLALMSAGGIMSAHAQLFGASAPGAAPAAPVAPAAPAVVKAAPAPVAATPAPKVAPTPKPTPAPAPVVAKVVKESPKAAPVAAAAKPVTPKAVAKAEPAPVPAPVAHNKLLVPQEVTSYMQTVTRAMQDAAQAFKTAPAPTVAEGEISEVAKSRAAGARDLALLDAIDKSSRDAGVNRMTRVDVVTYKRSQGKFGGNLGLFNEWSYPMATTHSVVIPAASMKYEPELVAGMVKAFVDLAVARGEPVKLNVLADSESMTQMTDAVKAALTESGATMDVTSSLSTITALQWVGSVPAPSVLATGPQPVFATVTELRDVEVAKVDPVAKAVGGIVGGIFGALMGRQVSNDNGTVTAAGGVAGAAGGATVAGTVKVPGLEVLYKTDAGELRSVVQEVDGSKYQIGGRVAVMSLAGKAHAIALN